MLLAALLAGCASPDTAPPPEEEHELKTAESEFVDSM